METSNGEEQLGQVVRKLVDVPAMLDSRASLPSLLCPISTPRAVFCSSPHLPPDSPAPSTETPLLPRRDATSASTLLTPSWNTARVTTNYILAHPSLTRGKRVLELGAGGALPSLASALGGAALVVATDYADADDALTDNIRFNVSANLGDGEVAQKVQAIGHTWGTDVSPLLSASAASAEKADVEDGRCDLVILSDLAFNHSQHDALIRTLDSTLSLATPSGSGEDGPCALVFLTHHRPRFAEADMAFFPRLAERGYAYERVVEEYTGPMFRDDPGDERVRGTVHGFRCWRVAKGAEEAAAEEK